MVIKKIHRLFLTDFDMEFCIYRWIWVCFMLGEFMLNKVMKPCWAGLPLQMLEGCPIPVWLLWWALIYNPWCPWIQYYQPLDIQLVGEIKLNVCMSTFVFWQNDKMNGSCKCYNRAHGVCWAHLVFLKGKGSGSIRCGFESQFCLLTVCACVLSDLSHVWLFEPTRVQISALPLISSVTLGKWLNLSAVQVPYPKWEQHSAYLLYFLVKTKCVLAYVCKVLRTVPRFYVRVCLVIISLCFS